MCPALSPCQKSDILSSGRVLRNNEIIIIIKTMIKVKII